ncbi:hypothetical protein PDJAM_G00047490 [Pangasius djambal]|uniref:Uncharacterized protein n=1 Tax=Pangasius djambal TaxID=1691987 RepID=A0ACC5YUN6_9TELE|nr:hypothetical protein [Pangasius djambal]
MKSHHRESRASSCFTFSPPAQDLFKRDRQHLTGLPKISLFFFFFFFSMTSWSFFFFFGFFCPSEKLDCDPMKLKHTLFFNKCEYF